MNQLFTFLNLSIFTKFRNAPQASRKATSLLAMSSSAWASLEDAAVIHELRLLWSVALFCREPVGRSATVRRPLSLYPNPSSRPEIHRSTWKIWSMAVFWENLQAMKLEFHELSWNCVILLSLFYWFFPPTTRWYNGRNRWDTEQAYQGDRTRECLRVSQQLRKKRYKILQTINPWGNDKYLRWQTS